MRGKVIHSHYVDGEARHRKKSILLKSERLTVLCVCERGGNQDLPVFSLYFPRTACA